MAGQGNAATVHVVQARGAVFNVVGKAALVAPFRAHVIGGIANKLTAEGFEPPREAIRGGEMVALAPCDRAADRGAALGGAKVVIINASAASAE